MSRHFKIKFFWAILGIGSLFCLFGCGSTSKTGFKCPPMLSVDDVAWDESVNPFDMTGLPLFDRELVDEAAHTIDFIVYTCKLRFCGIMDDLHRQFTERFESDRNITETEAKAYAAIFNIIGTYGFWHTTPRNVTTAVVGLVNRYGEDFVDHAHELYE